MDLLQGWTPMHCAADNAEVEILQTLLKSCCKSDVHSKDIQVTCCQGCNCDLHVCIYVQLISYNYLCVSLGCKG